ncbi:MAG: alpha/beta hydrolase-fold protein [Parvularcula sp.]|jgi:predicted alpha/beta superfamily hydrolase|nr:alpha/beta hydrolase-fold protein [Parvularcula sp.]
MLRIAAACLLLAACASALPASGGSEGRARPAALGSTYKIYSSVYGERREINIYVPDAEWAEKPLPVVYVVDGGLDQDYFHIAGLSQLTLINGERQPAIIVGVRTNDRSKEIVRPADDRRYAEEFGSGGIEEFTRFLIDEVIPFAEAQVPAGRRALMGESLAGLFVLELALHRPEAFDDWISVSPSLWWDDRRLAQNAPDLLTAAVFEDDRLYLTMGDEGGTMQQGLDEIGAALETQRPQGLAWTYVDRRDDESHATIYHGAARDAFQWLYGLPPYPQGEMPWWLSPE